MEVIHGLLSGDCDIVDDRLFGFIVGKKFNMI